jgi:hypothetical protein
MKKPNELQIELLKWPFGETKKRRQEMKKPNELQLKLLSLILKDVFLIEWLELVGFEQEIKKLVEMGYIHNRYGYRLSHDVLDSDSEIDWYVYTLSEDE